MTNHMSSDSTTYRAGIWTAIDGQADIVLTRREDQHLSDDDLMALARQEAAENDLLDESRGTIAIGEWTE